MTVLPQQVWTPESYLAFERASEEKHEYFNGEVRLMPRANYLHALIVGSTLALAEVYARVTFEDEPPAP